MSSSSVQKKIGIVGSGLIGRAWAMLFAATGYTVQMYDILESQLVTAQQELDKELHSLEEKGALRGQLKASEQLALIGFTQQLGELVRDAVHIQECVPEQLQLKKSLYSQLDGLLGGGTVVASSTSTFMPSLYSEGLQRRQQMLVAHPLNPPYFIPLVEIVPAPWTTAEAVERTRLLMLSLGQRPVTLKREIEGFATNRIQYAILNEVWRLVGSGILSVADVDLVLSQGLGLRYALLGSLETAHLNAPDGIADYFKRFGAEISAVSATYGPTPDTQAEGAALAEIARQCEELVPLEQLDQRRATRDAFLIHLAKLKKQFE
ncbi:lambda-crystallin homolog [Drosophila guanche]|uniref:Blast:Lambda-crystallin homolog n=1 Tax=Drosophila guanche TaxID=7266 RepID=A0A3B0J5X8_DROGU|nr:lambda-crystallin homolog [Drosophila guanche]SPP75273.1 blast:Lambda-crystallin homolog [Drosophila guanche]